MPAITTTKVDPKMCGIKHILIPSADPSGKASPQQVQSLIGEMVGHLQKNQGDFGAIAYKYSLDPTKVKNAPLDNCMKDVNKQNPQQFQTDATKCLQQHVGELDCFKPAEMHPAWIAKVNSMRPGTIDSVFLPELKAYSIIQKPLK